MKGSHLGLSSSVLIAATAASAVGPPANVADLRFFVGRTESVSVTKVVMERPFETRSVGHGTINADGSLELVQHVKEQGRREFDRRWHIHQVTPGRFAGTMSEAVGPVSIEKMAGRYRFRFVMKGNLSVEQWLTPERDMTTAHIQLTIRKFGFAVAHGDGWIRRADPIQLRANASLRGALYE
jgi:hypothetical protein